MLQHPENETIISKISVKIARCFILISPKGIMLQLRRGLQVVA
jgi:hypothetical protein